MTGDEVERSIEYLLKNQATLETQLERTSLQIEETNKRFEETNKRLDMYAETQTEFIQVVTRHIEAQGEINTSLRGMVGELAASRESMNARLDRLVESQEHTNTQIDKLAAAQMRTDARLDKLAETVERFITEGRNGKP
jgi:predicted S18 family serine protease